MQKKLRDCMVMIEYPDYNGWYYGSRVRTPIQLEDRIKDVLVAQGGLKPSPTPLPHPNHWKTKYSMVDIKEKTLAILNPLGDENSLMIRQ